MKTKRKPMTGCAKCPKYHPTTRYITRIDRRGFVDVIALCKPHYRKATT